MATERAETPYNDSVDLQQHLPHPTDGLPEHAETKKVPPKRDLPGWLRQTSQRFLPTTRSHQELMPQVRPA